MKDTNTSTACFQGDWQAVLEFLTGILVKDSVMKVVITRKEDHWEVDVTGLQHKKTIPPPLLPGEGRGEVRKSDLTIGLHDLYW